MNHNRFLQLGWIFFATVAAIAMAGGFQDKTDKIGVVDLAKVIDGSDFGKQTTATFNNMRKAREGLLEFIDTWRVLTNEQAQRIKELSLKATRTKEEETELDRIKADVVASNKRFNELTTKTNMSAEERTLVEEYARRDRRYGGAKPN